jgi:hypothetical protein
VAAEHGASHLFTVVVGARVSVVVYVVKVQLEYGKTAAVAHLDIAISPFIAPALQVDLELTNTVGA